MNESRPLFAPPRILMCSPEYFGIEYEINPWMSRSRQADRQLALLQWHGLADMLESLGVMIERLQPVAKLPDLVFTANAALIFKKKAVLSHFKHPERQREEPFFHDWLTQHGFEVLRLPEDHFFEGAGDALFVGDTLYAGYRIRSDVRSEQLIAAWLGCRVLAVELVDPYFYHLDTCFCPLSTDSAIFYPGAFDTYGIEVLQSSIPLLIPVREEEARAFACNAVVVGKHVITNTGAPQLQRDLRNAGFTPHETPLSEFVKAGGSAKCLTLRLDGENAAAWRESPAISQPVSP